MIEITPVISIDENEIKEEFLRSSGPGGQNINKVATAVQLKFNILESPSLPDYVRRRLSVIARNRISSDGVLTIKAKRFRTQEKNRKDALERFIKMIRKAAEKPKPRVQTKPSKESVEKRLTLKRHRAMVKKHRASVKYIED